MANELTVSMSLSYSKGNFAALQRSLTALSINVAATPLICDVLTVTTAELAIPLGGVTCTGAWAWLKNLDPTNYIEIRVSTGSTKFCKLLPGEAALFRIGSGISAPYAIADTASCAMEYILLSV